MLHGEASSHLFERTSSGVYLKPPEAGEFEICSVYNCGKVAGTWKNQPHRTILKATSKVVVRVIDVSPGTRLADYDTFEERHQNALYLVQIVFLSLCHSLSLSPRCQWCVGIRAFDRSGG